MDFSKLNGLIPAVIQDDGTNDGTGDRNDNTY